MPLDAEPDANGEWMIVGGEDTPVCVYAGLGHRGEKYRSHFATCPEAREWRNKK
jgi:hypothetical protein